MSNYTFFVILASGCELWVYQLKSNLKYLNGFTSIVFQVNQAIEANIVRPELPEEADRVEQLLVNI